VAAAPAEDAFPPFAHVDGTTFYLARTVVEHGDKMRGRLGKFVWRMANGKDGLYSDNVGPPLLANGRFSYWVLPADGQRTTHMNGAHYQAMLRSKAQSWLHYSYGRRVPRTVHLVKDGERCLWTDASLEAESAVGLQAHRRHPKYSPDLNAVENVWALLRQLLDERAPAELESRADFLVRLRRTVLWLNENRHQDLLELCTNLHERADAVLLLSGARTEF
jgi:hypothetical protein